MLTGERLDVRIQSRQAGVPLAAWLYLPDGEGPHPCVVMAHGFSLTRYDGLPAYAEAFAQAGVAALVFDHRYLGDSGGTPRQRFRKTAQLQDWEAAIEFARAHEAIDARRLILWGYSFAGGHVTTLAARNPDAYAAVLALCPFVNGLRRVMSSSPKLVAWILPRAIGDLAGLPITIPVTGEPGTMGAMTLPGEARGFKAATPEQTAWRNEISPGVFATVAFHRPLASARRITAPLWLGLGERDISVDKASIVRLAQRAPRSELHRYDYDHFEPFYGEAPARIAADQLAFLRAQQIV